MNDCDCIEQEEVGKYTVKVYPDDYGCQDVFDCDTAPSWGIDLSGHRDYRSPTYGDDCPISIHLFFTRPDELDEDEQAELEECREKYMVLPVYMYDHGGRTVSTSQFSCVWDSGCAGVTYISKAEAAKYGVDPEDYLTSMVKELNYHMTGQVYGFVVEDEDGEHVDSCWGFVGDSDYCLAQGKSTAEWMVKNDRIKRLSRLKEYVKNRVPLQVREQELRQYT